jgi:(2R)-sulfolactate sulfo-lyase subunit alpha
MKPDIVIHDSSDSVGVAVVEGIETGQDLTVWVMDTNESRSMKAQEPIPLGHKIALVDLARGDTLIKYGYDIGLVTDDIPTGHHVHIHNVKTKKW